jgi:hypothetical protein
MTKSKVKRAAKGNMEEGDAERGGMSKAEGVWWSEGTQDCTVSYNLQSRAVRLIPGPAHWGGVQSRVFRIAKRN